MKTESIDSSENKKFREWRDLLGGRGIRAQNKFLLMGEKLITEFMANPPPHLQVNCLLTTKNFELSPFLQKIPQIFSLRKELFDDLDVLGTHFPLLILQFTATRFSEIPPKERKGVKLISPLGDPRNLGAIARSALGFSVSHLVLTAESVHPYHPQAIKSSAGAILRLPWSFAGDQLSEFLQQINEPLFALDKRGDNLHKTQFPESFFLLIGEEGLGVPKTFTGQRITIRTGPIESLNAAVAASIALYEISNKKV